MNYIPPPLINAPTAEGQIKQLEEFIFKFLQDYNYTVSELEKEIQDLKGDK